LTGVSRVLYQDSDMATYKSTEEEVYVVINEQTGQTSPPIPDRKLAEMAALKLSSKAGVTAYVVRIVGISEPNPHPLTQPHSN